VPRLHLIVLFVAVSTAACEWPEMRPGEACGSCHGKHAPAFSAAGTLYAGLHAEAGDGGDGSRIDITDAAGSVVTLRPNRAGNFFTRAPLTPPLQVTIAMGDLRASMGNAPHGDCNACHGGDAGPGPIHVP
jgi:hypothetical protein